jgi:hypothetical protein
MVADDELLNLALQAHGGFTEHEMQVACLIHLVEASLRSTARLHNADISELFALAEAMLIPYFHAKGLSKYRVWSALKALRRAGQTFGYLTTIPT